MQPRPALRQRGDDERGQTAAAAGDRADADGAGLARGERVEVVAGRLHRRLHRLGVAGQQAAGGGQRSAVAAALDELPLQRRLQPRDPARDGRRRDTEPARGAPQRAVAGERGERREVAQVDAAELVREGVQRGPLGVRPRACRVGG